MAMTPYFFRSEEECDKIYRFMCQKQTWWYLTKWDTQFNTVGNLCKTKIHGWPLSYHWKLRIIFWKKIEALAMKTK
jgi:hypothetical protein